MSNVPGSNLGFPSSPFHQQNFASGSNFNSNQQFQPNNPFYSPQQYQNFGNQPFGPMGDFQNPTAGYQQPGVGYPSQMNPNYPPQQQPGYPSHPSSPPPSAYPPGGQYPNQPMPAGPGYPPGGQYPNPAVPTGPSGVAPGVQPAFNPSAPDLSNIQPIPGYEGLTFEETVLMPPSVPEWQPSEDERKPLQNLPTVSEDEVRDAAIQYASEHCCYGSGPAKDMLLREMQMISAFHYKLETFTEKRESSWKFVPYTGQPIDGPQNGPPPSPWDVMAVPQNYFVDSKVKIEVPHTAFTRPCHTCVGNGRIRCETCLGNGRKQCTWCKGRGRVRRFDKDEGCTSCNLTGFERCFKCSGTGQVKCKTCDSRGMLKGYVELIVTWTNHVDDYISEVSCMPKELVLEVTGQTAYEEENPRVFPIVQGAEEGVIRASSTLIQKHGSAFNNERILKQRQNLRIIPIALVKFEWKSKVDTFCVYGFEHKVYFKEYPQKCCCVVS